MIGIIGVVLVVISLIMVELISRYIETDPWDGIVVTIGFVCVTVNSYIQQDWCAFIVLLLVSVFLLWETFKDLIARFEEERL